MARVRIPRVLSAATLSLAVTLTGAGCGSQPQSTPTAGSTAKSAHNTSPAAGNSPADKPLPSTDTLKTALLTSKDLGGGFTSSTSDTTDSDSTVTGCGPLAKLMNAPGDSSDQAAAAFTAGETGPFVGEAIAAEPSNTFDKDYSELVGAVKSCGSLSFNTSDGAMRFDLSPINFGGAGSTAVRMDGAVQGIQVNGYLAIDRVENVAIVYYFFQIGSGSSQLASDFYTKADQKAHRVLF